MKRYGNAEQNQLLVVKNITPLGFQLCSTAFATTKESFKTQELSWKEIHLPSKAWWKPSSRIHHLTKKSRYTIDAVCLKHGRNLRNGQTGRKTTQRFHTVQSSTTTSWSSMPGSPTLVNRKGTPFTSFQKTTLRTPRPWTYIESSWVLMKESSNWARNEYEKEKTAIASSLKRLVEYQGVLFQANTVPVCSPSEDLHPLNINWTIAAWRLSLKLEGGQIIFGNARLLKVPLSTLCTTLPFKGNLPRQCCA